MSRERPTLETGCIGRNPLIICAGLPGFDPLTWQDAAYGVRLFPLQCQEK